MQIAGARRWGGWLVVVVSLAGLGGVSGTAAAAQAPSYQPDSPAGTEYAIPLDEARKTGSASKDSGAHRGSAAAQKSGSSSNTDDQSALFGEGIAPAKKAAAAGTARKPSKTTAKTTPAASAQAPTAGRLRPAASSISGTAVALGTGGLVLVLGAALTGAAVLSRRVPGSR